MGRMLFILCLSFSNFALAIMAYPGEITFKQSDGSTFQGHLQGDEWFSWVEDKQKNIITYNKTSHLYEYGELQQVSGKLELIPSGKSATSQSFAPASTAKRTQSNAIDRSKLYEIWNRKRAEQTR